MISHYVIQEQPVSVRGLFSNKQKSDREKRTKDHRGRPYLENVVIIDKTR